MDFGNPPIRTLARNGHRGSDPYKLKQWKLEARKISRSSSQSIGWRGRFLFLLFAQHILGIDDNELLTPGQPHPDPDALPVDPHDHPGDLLHPSPAQDRSAGGAKT